MFRSEMQQYIHPDTHCRPVCCVLQDGERVSCWGAERDPCFWTEDHYTRTVGETEVTMTRILSLQSNYETDHIVLCYAERIHVLFYFVRIGINEVRLVKYSGGNKALGCWGFFWLCCIFWDRSSQNFLTLQRNTGYIIHNCHWIVANCSFAPLKWLWEQLDEKLPWEVTWSSPKVTTMQKMSFCFSLATMIMSIWQDTEYTVGRVLYFLSQQMSWENYSLWFTFTQEWLSHFFMVISYK